MKMKILYIASLESIHSLKWINYFTNLGYEITVISLTQKINNFEFYNQPHLYIYNKYKNKYLNALHLISSIILKRTFFSSFDIMHVHYIGLNGFIALILKINNLVLTAWGDDIKTNRKNIFKNLFLKLILKRSKIITTDSSEMKNLILDFDKDLLHKLKIVNFGIDTNLFSKKKYDYKLENELNLENSQDYLKVISLRNHFQVYDLKTLIFAIKKFTKFNKKIKCYIYGSGPQTNYLKKLTTDLDLNYNIRFMGRYQQEKLPYIFSMFDCYVSSSLSDAGIAASTAEAMSCELCPISTNNSENYLWIQHKKSGFLFENSNVDQLADILRNLKDFDLRKIGKESRKIILKNNDYFNEMNKVNTIYRELLK